MKLKITLSKPASTCPKCHTPIRWYQNIPVISWISLKGKCGSCHNPISIRYPCIELLTAVCALIVVAVFGPTLQMLFRSRAHLYADRTDFYRF